MPTWVKPIRAYVARATVLKLLTYRLAMRPLRHHRGRQRGGAGGAHAVAAPVGVHPHALDLPDGRRLRADLGLEHHLAALKAGPGPTGRDQPGDPAPVTAATVADARIDADLADEHVDRRHQIGVEFVDPDGPHGRVDRAVRRGAQRHQRLVLTHVAGRAPGVFEPPPHRQHQLGAAHQR